MARHLAPSTVQREPAAIIGAIVAAVAAVLGLLVAFGVDLTDDQRTAILTTVTAVGPLVAALLIRPRVSPVATTVATVARSGAVLAGGASVLPTGVQVSPRATVEGLLDDELDEADDPPFYDPARTSLPPFA